MQPAPSHNIIDRDLQRWSRVHWIVFVGAMALVHGALIFVGSRHEGAAPMRAYDVRTFRLIGGTPRDDILGDQLELLDPSILSRAHARGFSGPAWMRNATSSYEVVTSRLQSEFFDTEKYFALTEKPVALFSASDAPQIESSATSEPELPAVKHVSRLQVGNGARALISVPPIPVQAYSDVLSNTVVQASVNVHGVVLSARVVSRSGFKAADDEALSLTRNIHFAPWPPTAIEKSRRDVTWETLTFQWFTVEPAPVQK